MLVFITVWALWFVSEIMISRLTKSGGHDKKGRDKGSFWVIWIAAAIGITSGVFCAGNSDVPIARTLLIPYIGLLVTIAGMVIRLRAVWTLGRMFTAQVTIRENHKIKSDGLYKILRHPSYSASVLSFIGLGISMNNWISLIVITAFVTFAMLYRIKIEEKVLIEQFGEEYKEYMKGTYRLIPFIY